MCEAMSKDPTTVYLLTDKLPPDPCDNGKSNCAATAANGTTKAYEGKSLQQFNGLRAQDSVTTSAGCTAAVWLSINPLRLRRQHGRKPPTLEVHPGKHPRPLPPVSYFDDIISGSSVPGNSDRKTPTRRA